MYVDFDEPGMSEARHLQAERLPTCARAGLVAT